MIPKPHTVSVVFYVSDIARTEAFYRDTLGIPLERMEGAEPFWLNGKAGSLDLVRMEGAEPFWLSGTLDGGLDLVFFEMDGVRGNTPALVFTVEGGGIDDVVAALVAQGVTIVTPVSEAPGGWSADFLDPDGFGLGLWQAEEFPRSLK